MIIVLFAGLYRCLDAMRSSTSFSPIIGTVSSASHNVIDLFVGLKAYS
jgi:hypothetical protein